MLKINNINVYYGSICALRNIHMIVEAGEIVTVLGANGAGKTTLLRAISGLVSVYEGEIIFEGTVINKTPAFRRVSQGIAMVIEGRGIFPDLTVRENLMMGAYIHRKDKSYLEKQIERLLPKFPILKERIQQKGGTLSGGEQQMLAICRALLSQPRLLLLDEPSMGLSPMMVEEMLKLIVQIRTEGTTILLVEQNANASLKVAERGYVLDRGEIALYGSSSELANNSMVKTSYLA